MYNIILRLDPETLENPDLDLRYVLPRVLAERSGGAIRDDGFDYVRAGEYPPGSRPLLVFVTAPDLDSALACIRQVLQTERVMDNDLSGVVVAVERNGRDEVVHPPGYEGAFQR